MSLVRVQPGEPTFFHISSSGSFDTAAHRFVAVVRSRELPQAWALQVAEVVRFFLARGWGIGSGSARGADQFALDAVVSE